MRLGQGKDQPDVLEICFRSLDEMDVPWMQICEFIDPSTERMCDSTLIGNKGRLPKVFGVIPVLEEKHWGLLMKDGSEKLACDWVRQKTARES